MIYYNNFDYCYWKKEPLLWSRTFVSNWAISNKTDNKKQTHAITRTTKGQCHNEQCRITLTKGLGINNITLATTGGNKYNCPAMLIKVIIRSNLRDWGSHCRTCPEKIVNTIDPIPMYKFQKGPLSSGQGTLHLLYCRDHKCTPFTPQNSFAKNDWWFDNIYPTNLTTECWADKQQVKVFKVLC